MLTVEAGSMWDTAGWLAFKRGQTDLAAQPNDLAVASKLAELAPGRTEALVAAARTAAAPHRRSPR